MDTLGQVVVFIIEVVLFSEVNMYREGTSKCVLYRDFSIVFFIWSVYCSRDPVVYIGDCWGLVLLCGSGILIGIVEISKLRSCCRNVWFAQDNS